MNEFISKIKLPLSGKEVSYKLMDLRSYIDINKLTDGVNFIELINDESEVERYNKEFNLVFSRFLDVNLDEVNVVDRDFIVSRLLAVSDEGEDLVYKDKCDCGKDVKGVFKISDIAESYKELAIAYKKQSNITLSNEDTVAFSPPLSCFTQYNTYCWCDYIMTKDGSVISETTDIEEYITSKINVGDAKKIIHRLIDDVKRYKVELKQTVTCSCGEDNDFELTMNSATFFLAVFFIN